MKKEYDFSKGQRGRFYRKGAQLRLPIYLDMKLQSSLAKLAQKKRQEIGEMLNHLLMKEVELLRHFL